MYQNRNHAPDSVIGESIRRLHLQGVTSYDIVDRLLAEGFQVDVDGSGYVRIKKGKEECSYPLEVTELPNESGTKRFVHI